MATTKSRINVSLPDDVRDALAKSAKRDQMPTATKAGRLLEIALEIEEGEYWNQIAEKRDKKDSKYIPLEEAFN